MPFSSLSAANSNSMLNFSSSDSSSCHFLTCIHPWHDNSFMIFAICVLFFIAKICILWRDTVCRRFMDESGCKSDKLILIVKMYALYVTVLSILFTLFSLSFLLLVLLDAATEKKIFCYWSFLNSLQCIEWLTWIQTEKQHVQYSDQKSAVPSIA